MPSVHEREINVEAEGTDTSFSEIYEEMQQAYQQRQSDPVFDQTFYKLYLAQLEADFIDDRFAQELASSIDDNSEQLSPAEILLLSKVFLNNISDEEEHMMRIMATVPEHEVFCQTVVAFRMEQLSQQMINIEKNSKIPTPPPTEL